MNVNICAVRVQIVLLMLQRVAPDGFAPQSVPVRIS